jgi:Na+/H+ antiporter NhaD/arsenite permease-like protein
MGILLLVYVLQDVQILSQLSQFLQEKLPNNQVMICTIGILSAIVDNGSLVAATQEMFSITDFSMDNALWEFIELCPGKGRSMLIIGSAAGVAVMEKEKMSFL